MNEVEQRKRELYEYIISICKMGIMPDTRKLNILINKFQIAVQDSMQQEK